MWAKRNKRAAPAARAPESRERDPATTKSSPLKTVQKLLAQQIDAAGRATAPTHPIADDVVSDIISRLVLDEAVPLYLASPRGEILYSNSGFDELSTHFRPQSRDAGESRGMVALEVGKAVQDVIAVGRSVTLQDTLIIEGRTKHYRSRHFPVSDSNNEIIAVGGTYIDSTPQVKALEKAQNTQARFSDFARATSDWFWEVDDQGAILSLSERMTDILGRSALPFIGKKLVSLGKFVTDDDGPCAGERAMAKRAPFRDQLFEIAARDGQQFLFHLSGVPVFDQREGAYQGYRGAGTDVTLRYKAEREALKSRLELEDALEELTKKNLHLDIASAEAEAALKSKSDFLAAMSHELRTPLNAITGFAEAMSLHVFGKLNEKYTTYSSDIVKAARHLLELINDVLDVAVIDHGNIPLILEPVNVRSIIDEALQLVVLRAEDKKIDTSGAAVERDWTVIADARRLIQIFINLFGNAVKFTPGGGEIGVEIGATGDDMVAITVYDTGIGIAADKHDVVFEKFKQITDDVYSRKEQGTGLGMHISRRLARMMGGDITLQSEPGEGSRFTVILPRG